MAKIPANLARIKHRDILEQIREITATPHKIGHWVDTEWADFDLIQDAGAILPWCSMDQFVVGRASWIACQYCRPMVNSYGYWKGHTEPDWYSNEVYLSKPGSAEWVAKQRATYPPDWALENFQSFARWEYQGDGELEHQIAIASAIWLIDTLGLSPQQVIDYAGDHGGAWRWGFDRLARVVAPETMAMESPLIPLEGFPVPKPWAKQVATDGPVEVLAVLLAVPSGIKQDHGRWIFPTVSESNGAKK